MEKIVPIFGEAYYSLNVWLKLTLEYINQVNVKKIIESEKIFIADLQNEEVEDEKVSILKITTIKYDINFEYLNHCVCD